jgi:hypothetical protein
MPSPDSGIGAAAAGVVFLYIACTMTGMITNIDIDESLVAEAMKVSGARTKREVVDRALRDMVARAQRPRFRDFLGVGDIDPGYDPKAPDVRGDAVGQWRVEQGRAAYKAAAPKAPPAPAAARKAARRK